MVPTDGVSPSSRSPAAGELGWADLTDEAAAGTELSVINGRSHFLARLARRPIEELIDLGQESADDDQLSIPERVSG